MTGVQTCALPICGALFAAVGIAGEDDDGNTANKVGPILRTGAEQPSADESTKVLAEMLNTLRTCKTADDLTVWSLSNKAAKNKLIISHQAEIVREYKTIQDQLKKGDENGKV